MTWVYVFLISFGVNACTLAGVFWVSKRAMRQLLAPQKTGAVKRIQDYAA